MPKSTQTSDTSPVVELSTWKQQIRDGDDGNDVIVRKQSVALTEDIGNRQIKFTISTSGIDRENDRLSADGWSLKSYRKNPVVMFAHDYKQLPVARAVSITQQDGNLVSTAEFATADLNPFADTVYRMIKGGFLNAVSVGFRPKKFKSIQRDNGNQGFDFEEQELLEYSVVPIPANPDALVAAAKHGIDLQPITGWAKSWLTEIDSVTTKGMVPSNPSDYGLAPMNEEWSRPSLQDFTSDSWDALDSDKRREIAKHFTYAVDMPPDNYGDLKLPHHRSQGADAVFRGVAAAAGRLNQTDFTADDFGKIRAHLANHYKEFDRVAPWERASDSWEKFTRSRDAMQSDEVSDQELGGLLRTYGFTDESNAILGTEDDAEQIERLSLAEEDSPTERRDMESEITNKKELDSDQLNEFLDVIRKEMNDIKVAVRETIKNVDRFQNAVDGSQDEDDSEAEFEVDDKEFVDLIEEKRDGRFDIDLSVLKDALVDATKESVAQVVNEEVRSMVNRVSGRVD
jgi:HK97 family phage prohead protease